VRDILLRSTVGVSCLSTNPAHWIFTSNGLSGCLGTSLRSFVLVRASSPIAANASLIFAIAA
jgi:hypothetical protein